MNIRQVSMVYFSPTESTKRVVQQVVGHEMGNAQEIDVTNVKQMEPDYSFLENEVVFVGAPVYGGRIPAAARQRFGKLHGKNTPAVVIVTYGNRDYDDALLELKELMESQGFRILAAAAVVTEHNIVHSIGTGRPDTADGKAIETFSGQIFLHLNEINSAYQIGSIKVKGKAPYREYVNIPLKPKAGRACNQCGLCIRSCPVQAISRTDASVMDAERCISCMRCIKVCPAQARKLNKLMLAAASAGLKKICKEHRAAEFFYFCGQ